jgi:hypothetical protein
MKTRFRYEAGDGTGAQKRPDDAAGPVRDHPDGCAVLMISVFCSTLRRTSRW